MRTGAEAIAFAKNTHSWNPSGMCQQFTRSTFGVGSYYGSAALAWKHAVKKHPSGSGGIPAGVPVFWTGGRKGYGHAAVSLGNGLVRSTDWPRSRQVNTARIDDISRAWGLHFAGWTEDINRVTVYKPRPNRPELDASNVAHAMKSEGDHYWGIVLKKAIAAEVGAGAMNLSTPKLGSRAKKRYKLVQAEYFKRIGGKPEAGNIDGIPGKNSLAWLGHRRGFNVSN